MVFMLHDYDRPALLGDVRAMPVIRVGVHCVGRVARIIATPITSLAVVFVDAWRWSGVVERSEA